MKTLGSLLGSILLLVVNAARAADLQRGVSAYVQGDYVIALAEFRPLAERGNFIAQYKLGVMCAHGLGVPQSYSQAAEWYTKAASQGYADAQFNLGWLYLVGQGIPRDYSQAIVWFRKAAAQGNAPAQSDLGSMYLHGFGVPQDYVHAVAWFVEAAARGNAYAQSNLGTMFTSGRGVTKNLVVGYALLTLSAGPLSTDPKVSRSAINNRSAATNEMTPAQIDAGQTFANEMRRVGMLAALRNHAIVLPAAALPAISSPQISVARLMATSSNDAYSAKTLPPSVKYPAIKSASIDLTYQQAHPARFPRQAILTGHQGKVVVVALLGSNGLVADAKVGISSGYPELDTSAVEAVKSWRYKPCSENGVPLSCYLREPVIFSLPKMPSSP